MQSSNEGLDWIPKPEIKFHNPGGDWNPGQGDNPIHIGGSKFIAN